MSYQIYGTDAVVLRGTPTGEADRLLALYTAEFGLTYVRARGLRNERSKQRYALQDFSLAHVSLVRGKGGWRLVGASGRALPAASTADGLASFGRLCGLVLRLVQGEGEEPYLYEVLTAAREFLLCECTDRAALELLVVARVLYALGYVAPPATYQHLFATTDCDASALASARAGYDALRAQVNDALQETQL